MFTWVSADYSGNIYHRYFEGNKERFIVVDNFKPFVFERKDGGKYRSIVEKHPLEKVRVSYKSFSSLMKRIADNFDELKETYFGIRDIDVQYISEKYPEDIEVEYSKVVHLDIDIETETSDDFSNDFLGFVKSATHKITAITYKFSNQDKYYVLGYLNEYTGDNKDFEYIHCADEREMLETFLEKYVENYPHIISGWNNKYFDLPYIYHRMKNILSDEDADTLSPFGKIRTRKGIDKKTNKENIEVIITGVHVLDQMELVKKYEMSVNFPDYKLETIASHYLNVGKLEYSGSIRDLHQRDYNTFIEYNYYDVRRVIEIEERTKFRSLVVFLAGLGKIGDFSKVLGTVAYWESILFNRCLKDNIIIPFKPQDGYEKNRKNEGAFVKEPRKGRYNWVVSYDVTSLYPSIVKALNISPDTKFEKKNIRLHDVNDFLEFEKNHKDVDKSLFTVSANGVFHRKDVVGEIPKIIHEFFLKRKEYKKKEFQYKEKYQKTSDIEDSNTALASYLTQWALKICLNSYYGALANKYFVFFDIDEAEAITITGKIAILTIEHNINRRLNLFFKTENVEYGIYCDTDSVYIDVDSFAKSLKEKKPEITDKEIVKYIDKFCKEIIYKEVQSSLRQIESVFGMINDPIKHLDMDREVIASSGIWSAKKKYLLAVYSNETLFYDKQKIKTVGLDSIKSDTPVEVRKILTKVEEMLLLSTNEKFSAWLREQYSMFTTHPIEKIATPKGVRNIEKYSDKDGTPLKGCPFHVRAALSFNYVIAKKGLLHKYTKVVSGDKVKIVPLKKNNPYGIAAIGFQDTIDEDVIERKWIDYKEQFYKTFLKRVEDISGIAGWDLEVKRERYI